eukprot:scaffold94310_cov39-Phaeocystis_antarctica.AAC.1
MIESSSCGGALIASKRECEAAATALGLSDTTAFAWVSAYTQANYPPGCVFASSRYLYVFGGVSSGSCSSSRQCICMFTRPSPPSPRSPPRRPPSPPEPPEPPPSPPP